MTTQAPPVPIRRSPLRQGGWVLLVALLLCLPVLGWRVMAWWSYQGAGAVGDGQDPASYGFVLEPLDVPSHLLVAGGLPREGLRALEHPPFLDLDQAAALNPGGHGGKFMVPSDRVVGLSMGGESRAYPLHLLQWYEVVNDTVGGVPVLICYSPLVDGVAVFERPVGPDGELLRFASSGLLYQSEQLAFERGSESLWSPLLGRAIAGPACGQALERLPFALVGWGGWKEQHPDTVLLARDEAVRKRRKRNPYGSYFGSDILRFPVEPVPDASFGRLKQRATVLSRSGERAVVLHGRVVGRACVQIAGEQIELVKDADADTLELVAGEPDWAAQAFWFAWYATHPGDRVVEEHELGCDRG
jgi:hypothetical protein